MSSVETPEEKNIKSNEEPSLEESVTEIPSTEKPVIIRKSLFQILVELFTGCTSKKTVKSIQELSEIKIEVVLEESKEETKENEVSVINEIKEEINEIKEEINQKTEN